MPRMKPMIYKKYKTYKKVPVSKAVKAYVAKTLDNRIEDKFSTASIYSVFGALSTSWTEYYPVIGEGVSGDSERIGRKIGIKSIELRGIMVPADLYNVLRVVVSISSSGAPMSACGVGISQPLLKSTPVGKVCKRILLDKYIPLDQNFMDGEAYVPKLKQLKYFKSFKKPLMITYGDSTTYSFDKMIVVSIISDSIITSHPSITTGYIVVKYEDA